MKKRVVSVICIVTLCLSMIGCYNYTEINKVTFATSIIFDKDEYDNVIIYLDCVRPYRDAGESSDKGRRIMFEGRGKTALEAIRNIEVASSNKLNFGQVRAYIFTEQVARKGIKKYIDLIDNDQQFSFKPYMVTYFGDVKSLLDTTSSDEEYLGLYLDQLIDKNKDNGKVVRTNVNDYLSDSLTGSNIALMTAIEIKKDSIDQKIELNGGVIMKDNHMISPLEEKDVLNYNLLEGKVKQGTFEVANPEEKDKFVTLDILEHYTKTSISIGNEEVVLKKNIQLKVSIGEIQGNLKVNTQVLDTIIINEEARIKKYLEELFKEYQENDIDILGVSTLVEKKYPKSNIEDILRKTKLEVDVILDIDGSSLVRDSI